MVEFYDLITKVSTCCLIEDYQMLHKALLDQNWDSVRCVMECLAETIRNKTEVPDGLFIEPSECSVIAMSCENGIVMNGNKDIRCANGFPVSDAGDISHCNSSCPFWSARCAAAEGGQILLEGEIPYVFDSGLFDFLDALDEYYQKEREQDV